MYHSTINVTSTVRKPPSNIVVTAEYPGSPSGKVEWLFSGESSDLSHFCVVIQADGEMEACSKDVPSGKKNEKLRRCYFVYLQLFVQEKEAQLCKDFFPRGHTNSLLLLFTRMELRKNAVQIMFTVVGL